MLNIGNKKLKMSNVGTTPLDSIYLGSTLIWKQKYLQWYDPEFKRVILETYNNGKEFRTKDELNLVIMYKLFTDEANMQQISFEDNKKIKTIKDLEKFTIFPSGNNLFKNCSSLGTEYIEATGETNYTELNIPESIHSFKSGSFINTNYTNIKFPDDGVTLGDSLNNEVGYRFDPNSQVFGNMPKLQGILNISNKVDIQNLQEFYNIGNSGQGIQVVLDTYSSFGGSFRYTTFGGWFQNSKILSLARTQNELEVGKIKIPDYYNTIAPGALYNISGSDSYKVYTNKVQKISGLFGGQKEYSNTNCSLLDIGESCSYIYGDSGNSINSEYTVICRAKVSPTMGLNDPELEIINPNLTENEKLMYPFKNGIKHLYVPDESVNLYKNDNQYTNSYTVYIEENLIVKYKKINVKNALGNVRCWDGVETKERNIGWSRFKDIIKPLSEYVES